MFVVSGASCEFGGRSRKTQKKDRLSNQQFSIRFLASVDTSCCSFMCGMPWEETEVDGVGDVSDNHLCWAHGHLPSQAAFQCLEARFKGFSGPVGSGKSAALCFECVRHSYLNPGRQGVLAAPTFSMLRDATLTSLFRTLDDEDVDYELAEIRRGVNSRRA